MLFLKRMLIATGISATLIIFILVFKQNSELQEQNDIIKEYSTLVKTYEDMLEVKDKTVKMKNTIIEQQAITIKIQKGIIDQLKHNSNNSFKM